MWLAILVTIIAATGNNIGKALQKEAVHSLPRFSVQPAVLKQYLRSRLWLYGLGMDLFGALLMIVAFALAPVSLVQPVSGVGLVSLAIFAHFHLKERMSLEEWCAVGMSMLGTLGLGVSSEDETSSAAVFSLTGTGALLLLFAILIVYSRRLGSLSRKRVPATAKSAAMINGLQAGVCFGSSAASCKAGILLTRPLGWIGIPLGLGGSIVLSSLGFMLQTLGLKDGNTVAVCTCAAVSSMATGILIGLLAMGEPMPSALRMKVLRLLSWIVTAMGVSALANGKGGFQEVLRAIHNAIPKKLNSYLGMRRVGLGKEGKLPTTNDEF